MFLVLINPQVGYFRNVRFLSLSNPDTALRGVALSSVWQNLGLSFIIVLAGLQAVPDELYEAATLDGYGPIRRFFRVTLPADLADADVPRRRARDLRLPGLRPDRHPHRRRAGRLDRDPRLARSSTASNRSTRATGAVMAIGLFGITLVVTLRAVPASSTAGCTMAIDETPAGWKKATWYVVLTGLSIVVLFPST